MQIRFYGNNTSRLFVWFWCTIYIDQTRRAFREIWRDDELGSRRSLIFLSNRVRSFPLLPFLLRNWVDFGGGDSRPPGFPGTVVVHAFCNTHHALTHRPWRIPKRCIKQQVALKERKNCAGNVLQDSRPRKQFL